MRKVWLVIIIISLLVCFLPIVSAVAIGVNKAAITYEHVLRGGYAESPVLVSTDTPANVSVTWEPLDAIADWIRVEPDDPGQLWMSRSRPLRSTIIVEPPEDAANGNYTGRVRVLTGALAHPKGQYGSSVQAAFIIRLDVEVIGRQIKSCHIGSFSLENVEVGFPLELLYTVSNTGNVRVRPTISVDVWDQEQQRIVLTRDVPLGEDVLPTQKKSFRKIVEQDLGLGQYWVHVSTPECTGEDVLELNVVEKGAITDVGELKRIDAPFLAEMGEIVPITAVFENQGPRTVSASFEGTVSVNDEIVGIIETEPLNIEPHRTEHIESFYQIKNYGEHIIRGRVRYNQKLSFAKEAFIIVESVGRQISIPWGSVFAVIVVLFVLLLLFMIRRKRRRRHIIRKRF